VPNSPQLYRRLIPLEERDLEPEVGRPPVRKYSSTAETFLSSDGGPGRKQSLTGSAGGWHRSRERTRQSAVQRLVERKLAQKEKEREKERDRSWAGSRNVNSSQNGVPGFPGRSRSREEGGRGQRDLSGTRSENGFMLGSRRTSSPAKENIKPGSNFISSHHFRASRSCSGSRYRDADGAEESITKTYITIGPGKPTRIREHSPSKPAKLSCEETVTSARERSAQSENSSPLIVVDLNRPASPSPQRKLSAAKVDARDTTSDGKNKEFLRKTSPLKSTNILKSFQSTNSDIKGRKSSFLSEKTIQVNQINKNSQQRERRLSIEILKTAFRVPDGDEIKRASVEPENSSSNRSSLSSLSGSSDSGVESDRSPNNIHLSQRRISLEQRFQARARISSPERSQNPSPHQIFSDKTCSRLESNTTFNEFISKESFSSQVTESSNTWKQTPTTEVDSNTRKPVPASRKISLPQPPLKRPEPAPRRRSSLHTILCSDR